MFYKHTKYLHLVFFNFGFTSTLADDAVELRLVDCFFRGGLGAGLSSSSSSLTVCFRFDGPCNIIIEILFKV